ncbi:MAG TPA: hypothetical protein VHS99_18700 [Chloroflexota bacterium]|jgi:hypothetical protein|nr:hypothetical protein [Chloroflexota bacterium]
MKRALVMIAASLAALFSPLLPTPSALAEETWCEVDPLVTITTPAGNRVVLYLLNAGPVDHAPQLLLARVSHTAKRAENGTGTEVTINVQMTDSDGHRHRVDSSVWGGPLRTGKLYSQRSGKLGHLVRHEFTLDVP